MVTGISIKLDDQLKRRVQRLAEARRRTPHWITREAIEQCVDSAEKREASNRDTLKA